MKLASVLVKNFRGIKRAELSNLGDTVIIAGPNGCGKSCIFDAIRLVKSIYGGYQQNEIQQWLGEFQIPVDSNGAVNLTSLLNDSSMPLQITCKFQLHPDERIYLQAHMASTIRAITLSAENFAMRRHSVPLAQLIETQDNKVSSEIARLSPQIKKELAEPYLTAQIIFDPPDQFKIMPSHALGIIFSNYLPGQLGLIDYHSPQRFFQREVVQNLSVNLDAQKLHQSQHALYNSANKYSNVKSEMAAIYVQEILAERAGVKPALRGNLTSTLQELFLTFFPDKKFEGPVSNSQGLLEFPVIGADGAKHDLNDLSSGEKEILYGYLRIRNSAPKYSIILLDEPELHLNPSLVSKLPRFYSKHLGQALDNQIWLITHSDALIREVVGHEDYSLFHMTSALAVKPGESQAIRLSAAKDAEQLVIDLVGDLATFRPGGKVVIFEGGGESEYDVQMVKRLFPNIQEKINCISGGGKERVRSLHQVLDSAASAGTIPFKIYSVTDLDNDPVEPVSAARFRWDVYHIENYLLEPHFIKGALHSLGIRHLGTELEVLEALRDCARYTMRSLLSHKLVQMAGDRLTSAINLKFDPNSEDVAKSLSEAIDRSASAINDITQGDLSNHALGEAQIDFETILLNDLATAQWLKSFRGRDILTQFADQHTKGLGYIRFRNLILSRMVDAGYQPIGMGKVLAKILAA